MPTEETHTTYSFIEILQGKRDPSLFRRIRVVATILSFCIGISILAYVFINKDDFRRFESKYFYPEYGQYIFTGFIFLMGSIFLIVMNYLQTGVFFPPLPDPQSANPKDKVIPRTGTLHVKRQIRKMERRLVDFTNTTSINRRTRNRFLSHATEQTVSQSDESPRHQFPTPIQPAHENIPLFSRFDEFRNRLLKELDSLSWRGNVNLTVGAIATIIGVILLGFSVFSEVTTNKDVWSFVSHFAPRLTLVILIEIFAFFFLSLYKSSLAEIKYFQNELTNIESKLLALQAAIVHGDKKTVADIIAKLAATERNHVLTKGQTTVELEKAKMEQDTENMVKHLASFIRKPPIWRK